MTAATTTPLQSKFGPIVADAAGTITVQEASDVLDCSRFRVCKLLNANAGRVPVTDVLALRSSVPPRALDAAPRGQARGRGGDESILFDEGVVRRIVASGRSVLV